MAATNVHGATGEITLAGGTTQSFLFARQGKYLHVTNDIADRVAVKITNSGTDDEAALDVTDDDIAVVGAGKDRLIPLPGYAPTVHVNCDTAGDIALEITDFD